MNQAKQRRVRDRANVQGTVSWARTHGRSTKEAAQDHGVSESTLRKNADKFGGFKIRGRWFF